MKLRHIAIENYARLPDFKLDVREHLVLVGANNVGKSSILLLIELLLGASIQQIYQSLSVSDIRDRAKPLLVRAVFSTFDELERAAFPDDIQIEADGAETLTVELDVRVAEDDPDSVVVRRVYPETSARSVSRQQLEVFGWHFLPANRSTEARYIDGRQSPLRTLLTEAELGPDEEGLRDSLNGFNDLLEDSSVLTVFRTRLADALSRAMPIPTAPSQLSLKTTADLDTANVLEDVTLFIENSEGAQTSLRDQSDGVRQLMSMTFFELAQATANIVAIDEPELHLHASSQRTIARLLARGPAQRLLATHSPYVLQRFEPSQVAVVKPDRTVTQIADSKFSAVQKEKASWWSPQLLEALTARRVLLVEGIADAIIVEAAAEASGLSLDRLGITVLDIGGAGNFSHVNALLGNKGFGIDLMGLVDLAESAPWVGGLNVKPKMVNIERVFVCSADLEDECVEGMGAAAAASALIAEGVREVSILQSTGVGRLSDIQTAPMAAYLRKDKIGHAVAIARHLTASHVTAMPAIDGLMKFIAN